MDDPQLVTTPGQTADPSPVQQPVSAPSPAPVPSSEASPSDGFTSIRDHVAGMGLSDLASKYTDDESFVNFLVQQHRNAEQSQQLNPYAQRYLQHAQAFEQFLQQQQQATAQVQPQAQKRFWNPPEYNPSWSRFVARDDRGNLALVPGAGGTPDIIPKIGAYDQYVRDFVHNFTNDPSKTLTPLIHEVVQPLLEQHLQQQFGVLQERTAAREFLSANNAWLYASNNGQTLRDGTGHLVLSENGQLFANLVHEAEQMGLDTVAKQQHFAGRVLSAAGRYGTPGGAQQAPGQNVAPTANDQLKQQFLHRPNPAGAIGLSSPTPQPTQDNLQLSLAQILRRNLAAGGINDAALASDFN